MSKTKLLEPRTTAQLAIALALLITFSTGLFVGRHVDDDIRMSPDNAATRISGPHFPYKLNQASRKVALPNILQEVSAVSYVDGAQVGLVQDELGIIFFCSLLDGHVLREVPFASSGDFEGLVILDDEAWVLRSDGDLYQVSGLDQQNPVVNKIETFLKVRDDTEGLTYDAAGKQLLVSLKAAPSLNGVLNMDKRAVYAFQLAHNTMVESPYLLLDMAELKRVYSNQVSGNKPQTFNFLGENVFQPSDLAIHPITGHIYHIAAAGQLLVVSDRSGQIYFVRDLPKEIFRQPEGISFDPIGNMIIVSEGAGAKSMLFEFRYQPNPPAPAETESGKSLSVFPHL
jgi:uncharacterized protein YjiK